MEKVLRSNFFYSFLALLFALLLFFNANSGSTNRITQTNQTFDTTVYDVPIQVDYDESKYYVSGFSDTVTVHLSSVNRIKLNQEANSETRSFKVVADLTKQAPGTMDVILRVINLTSGVEAVIDPATISVTIENKVTKTFSINPIIDDKIVNEGYEIGRVSLSQNEVTVTTGEQTMTQISEIQAKLNANRSTSESFSEDVRLQAVNAAGEVLPVTIDPETVTADVEITAPTKKVGVTFYQDGTLESGIDHFIFQSKTSEITATGPNSLLAELSQVEVPVDITDVRKESTLTVEIPTETEGIHFSPQAIQVVVIPVFANGSSTSTTNQESTSSTSSEKNSTQSSISLPKETTSLPESFATEKTTDSSATH